MTKFIMFSVFSGYTVTGIIGVGLIIQQGLFVGLAVGFALSLLVDIRTYILEGTEK